MNNTIHHLAMTNSSIEQTAWISTQVLIGYVSTVHTHLCLGVLKKIQITNIMGNIIASFEMVINLAFSQSCINIIIIIIIMYASVMWA